MVRSARIRININVLYALAEVLQSVFAKQCATTQSLT